MVVCRTRSPTSIIRKIRPTLICSFESYCIKFINMHNYLQTEGREGGNGTFQLPRNSFSEPTEYSNIRKFKY